MRLESSSLVKRTPVMSVPPGTRSPGGFLEGASEVTQSAGEQKTSCLDELCLRDHCPNHQVSARLTHWSSEGRSPWRTALFVQDFVQQIALAEWISDPTLRKLNKEKSIAY